jgi:ABC-type uncharacterized transport system ATPase subunit
MLLPENESCAALLHRLGGIEDIRRIASDMSETKSGCIVSLHNESDKSHLLRAIAQNDIGVGMFTVVEPTLEEIFVEKAGDLIAAV